MTRMAPILDQSSRRPDPLQLPETGGPELVSPAMRVWLAWTSLSIVVALVGAYAVGALIRTSIETGIVLFGVGLGWSALTPAVIRRIGRWLRA